MRFSGQGYWSGLPFPTLQGIWMLNKWGNIQMTGGHSDMELREGAWNLSTYSQKPQSRETGGAFSDRLQGEKT